MLSSDEGVDDSIETGSNRGYLGLWDEVSGFGAGELEFSLEIRQCHVEIAHGHFGIGMAEQFHECRKAHPSAKHLRGIGMPELMRHDPGGESERMTDLMQVITKLVKDCVLAVPASEQSPVGGQRIEVSKEAQPMDELTDK